MTGTQFPADIDYDVETGGYYISCITVVDGEIWAWDPERDEPVNYSESVGLGEVR